VKPWRGVLAWAALVAPLWLTCVWCTAHEPIMGDGWGHALWHRDHQMSLRGLVAMASDIYTYENPRLGQLATLLVYTPGPYHVIVTPIVELGALALLTALALGRWPSVRRPDDALAGLLVTAAWLACVPQVGPMWFYRPYAGNYTFGLALNLLWLWPYRRAVAGRALRAWAIAPMIVLGLAAGLSNEHTGLAMLGLGLAATLACGARGALRAWMIAGLVALLAGYVLLLGAPGQHVRYGGLADQAGVLGRIADRGVAGNLGVLARLAVSLWPLIPLVGVGLLGRPTAPATERWALRALALAGVACTLTLLASPKIGPRLYAASVGLIAAAVVGWLMTRLDRLRIACAAAAAIVVLAIAIRLVTIYAAVGPLGADRWAKIAYASHGSTVRVPRYPVDASRYFLGDDLANDKRLSVAAEFAGTIILEGGK
jgi:hypothetical protein